MNHYFNPLNLRTFTVEDDTVTRKQVVGELKNMVEWVTEQQDQWAATEGEALVQRLLDAGKMPKGSLNRWADRNGIKPQQPAAWQPYNYTEMFRTNTASIVKQAQQTRALEQVIAGLDDPTPENVLATFQEKYGFLGFVPWHFITRTIDRVTRLGVSANFPRARRELPFSATDTHFAPRVRQENNYIFFTYKSAVTRKPVTLRFKVPAKERFEGEATRPTVRLRGDGELVFQFTIKRPTPVPAATKTWLGVDAGKVTPYVGTLVNADGDYSPPILPSRPAQQLHNKTLRLYTQREELTAKILVCEARGHTAKQELLTEERRRVTYKITRLKTEAAKQTARHLTDIAHAHRAQVIVENLKWLTVSGKWDHSATQTALEDAAVRKAVKKPKRVNPKNTSQDCARCGNKVKHSARSARCLTCLRKVNRDVNASRNIARRGGAPPLRNQNLSCITRLTEPVTPGQTTHFKSTGNPTRSQTTKTTVT